MVVVRCPRCRTVQATVAGLRPTCSLCGFTGRLGEGEDPRQAVHVPHDGDKVQHGLPRRQPATGLPALSPGEAPRPRWLRPERLPQVGVLAAVMVLVLLGATLGYLRLASHDGPAPAQASALAGADAADASRAEAALRSDAAAFRSALGALAKTGDWIGSLPLASAQMNLTRYAGALVERMVTAHVRFDDRNWSATEARIVLPATAKAPSRTAQVSFFCTDHRTEAGALVFERRLAPDRAACLADRTGLDLWAFAGQGLSQPWVTATPTATGWHVTADAAGSYHLEATFTFGPRAPILAPAGNRTPAFLDGIPRFQPGNWTFAITSMHEVAAPSEFELRVATRVVGQPEGARTVVPFDGKPHDGYIATYTDNGDHRVGPGDVIALACPWTEREQVSVWVADLWADGISLRLV